MAAPPKIKRLSREEFKDAPGWIDKLLYWLNILIEYVTLAFDHQITFDENIRCQIKSLSIVAGAAAANNTISFQSTMKVAPRFLFLGQIVDRVGNYTPIGAAVSIDWRYDAGSVFITSITGLTVGHTYDFNLLLV